MDNIRFQVNPGGQLLLFAEDVTGHLRARADEYAEGCNVADDGETATAYRAVATELRQLADRIDTGLLWELPTAAWPA